MCSACLLRSAFLLPLHETTTARPKCQLLSPHAVLTKKIKI